MLWERTGNTDLYLDGEQQFKRACESWVYRPVPQYYYYYYILKSLGATQAIRLVTLSVELHSTFSTYRHESSQVCEILVWSEHVNQRFAVLTEHTPESLPEVVVHRTF